MHTKTALRQKRVIKQAAQTITEKTNMDSDHEFQDILSALHERALSDWERERLWELLEEDETRVELYYAHFALIEDIASLSPSDMESLGHEQTPTNIVSIHQTEPGQSSYKDRRRVYAVAGLAASLAFGLLLVISPTESGDETVAAAETTERKPAEKAHRPVADDRIELASLTTPVRAAGLQNDDKNDEAVALSGAAALANSRSPRGGIPEGAPKVPEVISFNHHVRPILSENCFFCHGVDEAERKAGLRLDTFEGATEDFGGYQAIKPGDAEASESWIRILSEDADDVMPPPSSHRKLSAADKEIIRRWIEEGAQYDKHWAFAEVQKADPVTQESENAWGKNAIDAFLIKQADMVGLTPNPEARPETIARRLALDLTGVPPTQEEVAIFVAEFTENADTAVAKKVESLLASPHFGERMAMPWLDAARYADSNGFQQDGNRHQWPWRDWVVNAYNANMPFDQFSIEQLAGDLLPDPTPEQIIATGFNRNHMLNGEGGAIKEEQRINYVIDRVDATATTWLGLTMACAQCHSHKYDPITHEEYFQFFAFFNNVPETGGVDKRLGRGCDLGSKSTIQLSKPWHDYMDEAELARINESLRSKRDELKEKNEYLDSLQSEIQAKQATWESSFTPQQLEDRKLIPGSIANIVKIPAKHRNKVQKGMVRSYFLKRGDHGVEKWSEYGRRLDTLNAEIKALDESIIRVMVMEDLPADKARKTFILARGDYQSPTDEVSPGTPAFLPPMSEGAPKNRLGLAQWLVDGNNPLTARVAVNRLWQQFFGIGIVKTSEDFGVQSELPKHPELLDWLAAEFVDSGWDVKHMIRLITNSAAYRQTASATEEELAFDPENRYVMRSSRYRLPSMTLRDQGLAVAGLLKPEIGGEPVYPQQPKGLWTEFSFGKISYPHNREEDQLHRRSLYTFWRRTTPPPNMFDSASRQICSVKSSITNTPLHALTLLNDETYVHIARALARRMVLEGGSTPEERISFGFEAATARQPSSRERQILLSGFIESLDEFSKDEKGSLSYIGSEAFQSDQLSVAEAAAYTRIAQVILNLDETLNRP